MQTVNSNSKNDILYLRFIVPDKDKLADLCAYRNAAAPWVKNAH